MKKIILMTTFITAISLMSFAAPLRSPSENLVKVVQEEIPIKTEELPDAVKATLANSYADWTIQAAFRIELIGGNQYKTKLVKENNKKDVKFDSEGKVIDSTLVAENTFQPAALQTETPIKVEELPEAVRKSILTNFSEWTPTAAFEIKKANEEEVYYKVELMKMEEKKMVKFNKEGEVI